MQLRQLALLVGLSLSVLGTACGPTETPPITLLPPPSGTSTPSAGANGVAGGSSAGSGGGSAQAGSGTGGDTPAGGGAPATAGAAGAAGSGTAGASGGGNSTLSAGCGKPLPALVTAGKWSEMANQDSKAGRPPPVMVPCTVDPNGKAAPACIDGMKKRGYWVFVKPGYDPNKPSKVIYEGAGCGDTSDAHGGTAAYPYDKVNGNSAMQVIQVGMNYSRNDNCYDNANPQSNDFTFFPMLMDLVENQFCVDKTKQYWSGYSTGSWVGNQFTCAFPDRLRGVVFATGEEPAMQPTCKSGFPVAGMFLHDDNDTYNKGVEMQKGCARLLRQNGCQTTQCDFKNTALSDAYPLPTGLTGQPSSLKCVSFKGCPATSPVIWCSTALAGGDQSHYIGAGAWVYTLLWDTLNRY